jgi:hypothetical protein
MSLIGKISKKLRKEIKKSELTLYDLININ